MLLLSSILIEESFGFVKIVDFLFMMDLNVLKCPEHDLNFSEKCLSVHLCVCVCDKKIVASSLRTNR